VVRYFGVTPKLTFKWTAWPGATGYRFVATRSGDFDDKEATTATSKEPSLDLETLEESDYLWGVFTDEGQPLFLAPRRLSLVRSRVKTPTTLQQWGQ
jgi:hypothetical protein